MADEPHRDPAGAPTTASTTSTRSSASTTSCAGDQMVVGTGISNGDLLRGVRYFAEGARTQSIVLLLALQPRAVHRLDPPVLARPPRGDPPVTRRAAAVRAARPGTRAGYRGLPADVEGGAARGGRRACRRRAPTGRRSDVRDGLAVLTLRRRAATTRWRWRRSSSWPTRPSGCAATPSVRLIAITGAGHADLLLGRRPGARARPARRRGDRARQPRLRPDRRGCRCRRWRC